ncbi:hypothetical protein DERF_006601 [Dermatophagoides farinae]|uniref:Uncharacterized protein n=1 Tax=Dermatophagoides farinae TaxID=6954 RepID=A0A922HWG6_DERFA|nr:hypothetical protein DERF_006601 [Dermatophagoides farinae]
MIFNDIELLVQHFIDIILCGNDKSFNQSMVSDHHHLYYHPIRNNINILYKHIIKTDTNFQFPFSVFYFQIELKLHHSPQSSWVKLN